MEKIFNDPIKNYIKKYDNIQNITVGQGSDHTTGCLIDFNYFKKHDKMIAIDLSKEQTIDADPKAIQQIIFPGNLSGNNNRLVFFFIKEAKETILDLYKELLMYC